MMHPITKRVVRLGLVGGLAALLLLLAAVPAFAAVTVNGAGATFPYPIYSKWAREYESRTGVRVNYQPIGSGGGISAIKAGTVLFGGTDAPLTLKEQNAASLVQFPMCSGGVVPIVNIPGVASGKLRLTGGVLAQIYLRQITRWNDSRIKSLNPGVSLPSNTISVVHRSDGSGTTWIFTHYLSAVSTAWRSKVGADKSVRWPTGVGAKGNEGVATAVQRVRYSIGYVEFAYARQSRIPYTQLRNKAGRWVMPSLTSFAAAASQASWTASNGYYTTLVNKGGSGTWPIVGATFILVRKSTSDYTKAHAMLKFFDWCYKNTWARSAAKSLQYVSMPLGALRGIENTWHQKIRAGGKAAW
jgi:phosphate transport system substrate-binding protein